MNLGRKSIGKCRGVKSGQRKGSGGITKQNAGNTRSRGQRVQRSIPLKTNGVYKKQIHLKKILSK